MPSDKTNADYHEGTVKLILEMVGELVDEDTMKKIRLRAAGRAGGKQTARNAAENKSSETEDLQKRLDLGLEKDHSSVRYEWRPALNGDFCGRCIFYTSFNRQGLAGECLLVVGEILQAGVCNLYSDIEPKFNKAFAEMLERADQERVEMNATPFDEIARSKSEDGTAEEFGIFIDFTKAIDDEEHTVTGIVLQPDIKDSQDDIISAKEIRMSMFDFEETSQQIGVQHEEIAKDVKIVENWTAREDMELGGQKVLKGSWIMTVRIHADDLWAAVKNGKFTGFSIRGTAIREEI